MPRINPTAPMKKTGFVIGGVATAMLGAAQYAYTSAWEGYKLTPYRDSGGVLTVCIGHTGPDVIPGKTYTKAECEKIFVEDMATKVDAPLSKCVTATNLAPETVIALRDFTFNVGGGAACKSTLVRLLNAGKVREACNQLPRWVFVKAVLLPGLENRRWRGLPGMPPSERALCLSGLE